MSVSIKSQWKKNQSNACTLRCFLACYIPIPNNGSCTSWRDWDKEVLLGEEGELKQGE